MAPNTYSLVIILVITFASTITCFEYIVDFEGLDCGKSFLLSDYDVFVVKADPNPNSIGNPSFCKASFVGTTRKQFVINVDVIEINDCEVKLNFYDNEPTEKFAKYSLSCNGSPSPVLTTSPGNLTVRLDKPTGGAKGYRFYIKISTGSQGGSGLQDNGGGGVGVPVGIGVGVAVFLIIIIAIVCFLVCRQMRKEKHKNAYNEPSVFATVSSRDPEYESEPRSGNQASSRRQREEEQRQRERERDREREEQRVPKLPEPKVNGILKGSPGRRRKRGRGGESGYDNEGYSASVSSTDESADFDFESYKKSIEEGGPASSRPVGASSRDSGSFRTSGSYRVGFKGIAEEKSPRSQQGSTSARRGRSSQGYTNKAYSRSHDDSSVQSSRRSYANSMSTDDVIEGRSSYRMKEWSNDNDHRRSPRNKRSHNYSTKGETTVMDTSFSEYDETRSSVKFDLRTADETKRKTDKKSKPKDLDVEEKGETLTSSKSKNYREKESVPDTKEDKNVRNNIRKIESDNQKRKSSKLTNEKDGKRSDSKHHSDEDYKTNRNKSDRYSRSPGDKGKQRYDGQARSRTRSESRATGRRYNYDGYEDDDHGSHDRYGDERNKEKTGYYIDADGHLRPKSQSRGRSRSKSESRHSGRMWYSDRDFPPSSSASSSTSNRHYHRSDREDIPHRHRDRYYDERDYEPYESGNRRKSRSLSQSSRTRQRESVTRYEDSRNRNVKRVDSTRSSRHNSRSYDDHNYHNKRNRDYREEENSHRRSRSHSAPRRRPSSRSRTSYS